jgi:protocatechuate 3,4-dioxygenase beta subunit
VTISTSEAYQIGRLYAGTVRGYHHHYGVTPREVKGLLSSDFYLDESRPRELKVIEAIEELIDDLEWSRQLRWEAQQRELAAQQAELRRQAAQRLARSHARRNRWRRLTLRSPLPPLQ